ncbi:hypothetical protein I6A84_19115 [Frankia sp. CNm7]|uniref:Uncharacterized protein n=1 Tax=Frankia nepalensis TaxID=1836974 RepID=A0A937RIA1_9ACTN|nr:hypothetical protein [Frankia nepalensis]MBL7500699.1 hypothetical protein [Frankia nepalensis]MBL7515690.1 hypothetical protein [Frankia nepalensis]MBL7520142.1 hypothetical protein [Frankia nepalensis]MBL7632748.1 hypothetical protein [Frankia nepalensis]
MTSTAQAVFPYGDSAALPAPAAVAALRAARAQVTDSPVTDPRAADARESGAEAPVGSAA